MSSPILDQVYVEVEQKTMDTTFIAQEPLSIFRQEPSEEVDAAWRKLGDTRPIPISRDRVLAIGKDPSQAVQVPESWGYGNETYFGRVDAYHQLHCLDALRREAYFEHYYGYKYPNGFNDTTPFHRAHLAHCVHILLRNIMCTSSTDIFTHIWIDSLEHPWPDFQINHQCKNFDAIAEWQKENAMDEKALSELTKPEGYPYRVANHKFKEVHGWFEDHEDDGSSEKGEVA
ncbi:hypothetical protein LSUE1_G007173 [Lachnellula suecica]|uniref:Tat pathway signal sequence n=1 Tax=Lachnellula suecica TaxID=602035 RepID=A0A8T9C326_9HELO|nr:hypothetical protein LSUE1_G007173 [Lachnellula suecica]